MLAQYILFSRSQSDVGGYSLPRVCKEEGKQGQVLIMDALDGVTQRCRACT